ncbi:MAG: adenylyltransferase/cytidyltransferase family protein [Flavobacteriales bacterium]
MKLPFNHEKVLERESAIEQVASWKGKKERIVFTNGCFDLLHPGHIDLLTKAKGLGDRLVIGLNSDHSIKRLEKGSDRPIIAEGDRALLIASLEMVDLVVGFDEGTPHELIKILDPHVLAKGEDYEESAIVGKDHVEGSGGRVVRLPLLKGYSTSALIERVRDPRQGNG